MNAPSPPLTPADPALPAIQRRLHDARRDGRTADAARLAAAMRSLETAAARTTAPTFVHAMTDVLNHIGVNLWPAQFVPVDADDFLPLDPAASSRRQLETSLRRRLAAALRAGATHDVQRLARAIASLSSPVARSGAAQLDVMTDIANHIGRVLYGDDFQPVHNGEFA